MYPPSRLGDAITGANRLIRRRSRTVCSAAITRDRETSDPISRWTLPSYRSCNLFICDVIQDNGHVVERDKQ